MTSDPSDRRDLTLVIDALREVAKELSNLPWSTGTEETLEKVANRIEEKRNA